MKQLILPFNESNSQSPSSEWDRDSTKHALDDLFKATFAYRKSIEYLKLAEFISKFRFYSPYNAFLIYTQRPGATYVAPAYRWAKQYGRKVKPNANPIVILKPKGPVMFVFDVSDTESLKNAPALPESVTDPFRIKQGTVEKEFDRTIENCKRDGIKILYQKVGSQAAGSIQTVNVENSAGKLQFKTGEQKDTTPIYEMILVKYEICLKEDSENKMKTENYATLVHELAHLYCGHLGTPNKKWWPDRRGLSHTAREFEAESVSYLVCKRMGIKTTAEEYLSGYVDKDPVLPKSMSLECIMKASGLIEQMAGGNLKLRKDY
ncbi:MAG: hypothetical protein HQK62_07330 [Desulfamplus sp.]|nr:hypothetical protein [Desulfamplus sp.]